MLYPVHELNEAIKWLMRAFFTLVIIVALITIGAIYV